MRAALAAVTAAVVVLLAVGTAEAPSQSPQKGVARFRETVVTHHKGDGLAGSVETWRTKVWLPRRNQIVGTGVLACAHISNFTSIRECVGTYILPRGRIQVAGEVINLAGYQLSIVGGSGIYAGGGGVAVFDDRAHETLITLFLIT